MAVEVENGEDLLDRIIGPVGSRREDLFVEDLGNMVDNGQQEILLGRKEVVEAPTCRIRFLNDLVDSGLGVALAPKKLRGGGDQAFAGCSFARPQGISR